MSKYVDTGLLAAFVLLSYVGFLLEGGHPLRGARARGLRLIEWVHRLLMAAFLANANLTVAFLVRGDPGRRLCLLCAMEILFLIAFMALYRIVYERANMMLFNNICMLLSIGFVIIARIASYGDPDVMGYKANEPIKQFVMASAGLVAMLALPFCRRFFEAMRHLGVVFALLGIAALGGVLLLGAVTNGAQITYTLAGFTFQPSEFVKILFILGLAGLLAGNTGQVTRARALFVSALALVHVGILVLSRDLGSALIYFAVYLLMLFLATGKWAVLFGGAGAGMAGAVACYFLFSHVHARVEVWQDPFAVIDGAGYQIAQSLFAISYGGLWGAGLTQGAPDRIPFVESDFIFAAIVEEMGILFGILLLLLSLNCFLRMLLLAAGHSNRFFQLFTYGVAVCYIFQTFLTVGGETKFIPLTGVTLPLVSYGGSSVLSTLIMLGMIEMVYILHEERSGRYLPEEEMDAPVYAGDVWQGMESGAYSGADGPPPAPSAQEGDADDSRRGLFFGVRFGKGGGDARDARDL